MGQSTGHDVRIGNRVLTHLGIGIVHCAHDNAYPSGVYGVVIESELQDYITNHGIKDAMIKNCRLFVAKELEKI
jgi:hypothetical protein